MKLVLTTLLFFGILFANGQERKMRFGLQAFPNFSTGIPKSGTLTTDYYKGIETFTFTYSAGIQLDWEFAEKWTSSNGILYKTVGEKGKTIPADPLRGFLYPMEYGFSFRYVELQLNFLRKISESLFLEFGLSPSYLLVSKFGTDRGNYFMELNKNLRSPFALNCNLGFGYNAKVGKVNLRISPYGQFDLLNSIHEFIPSHGFPSMHFIALGIRTVAIL